MLVKLFIMATDYKESNGLSTVQPGVQLTGQVYENIELNLVEPLEEQFATLHSHKTTQFSMEENTAYGCACYDSDNIQEVDIESESYEEVKITPFPASSNSNDSDEYEYHYDAVCFT